MSYFERAIEDAAAIRRRLRTPPNAVPDLGIDLKRKIIKAAEPPPVVEIPITDCSPEAEPVSVIEATPEPLPANVEIIPTELALSTRAFYPPVHIIVQEVAKFYAVSVTDICSARRTADIVKPRQIAMYLAKTLTLRSLPDIGRRMGGRDHTTVLHGVRKIERSRQYDERLCDELEVLKLNIAARLTRMANAIKF